MQMELAVSHVVPLLEVLMLNKELPIYLQKKASHDGLPKKEAVFGPAISDLMILPSL